MRRYIRVVAWDVSDCRELAAELLVGLPTRWAHVCAVAELAQGWMDAGLVGDDLVKAAWLHDIGYADSICRTGMHALDGGTYLELHGLEAEVVALVVHHTGAWAEAEERGLTRALLQFDLPDADLLDALTLADLVRGPSGNHVPVHDRLAEILLRYDPQHPVHRAVTRSQLGLTESAARAAGRLHHPM